MTFGRLQLVWMLCCGCLALALGCHSLRADVASLLTPADDLPAISSDDSQEESSDTSDTLAALNDGAWRVLPAEVVDIAAGDYRWRNEQVDALWRGKERVDMSAGLTSEQAIARANAAIVLARRGESKAAPLLATIAGDATLETNQRSAAIESLARLGADGRSALNRLLADSAVDESWQPALEAELLQAAGICQVLLDEGRIDTALRSKSAEVRAAVLEYHARWSRPLSQRGLDLRTDPDPRVRLRWIDAVAASSENAVDELTKCLRSGDLPQRIAAVHALGRVPGEDSRRLLHEQLRDPGELIRAAAVDGLAQLSDEAAVVSAADDASWRVRKAVAQALAHFPSQQAGAVAKQLLVDQSPDVEVTTVESLAAWPLEMSGPLLLSACGQRALATRERAFEHLSNQWPPAKEFSPTAPAERRAVMLVELQTAWAAEFGGIRPGVLSDEQHAAARPTDIPHLDEIRNAVSDLAIQPSVELRRRHLARLRGYDRQLVTALEYLVDREQLHLVSEIYRDVLPPHDPAFRLLVGLESPELAARRNASGRLASLALQEPLSALVLVRLAELIPREEDPVVWGNVWRMIDHDTREPALRLAYAAAGHREVEVRRKACEFLAQHPAPAHVPILFRALGDPAPNVARAAAAALGRCGPLDDVSELKLLLGSRDPELRFAAAVSLAQLDAEEGYAALERYTYEGDIERRRDTAVAMGELGDERFLPALIRLLQDRDSVRRAAVHALVQVSGTDAAESDGEFAASLPEQVERWQQWWAQQQQGRARE